jgi:hypothetical protein
MGVEKLIVTHHASDHIIPAELLRNGSRPEPVFPRLWELFPYVLTRRVRGEVYEPYHQEMLEDYLLARKSYRTKPARRWLTFAFTVRTAYVVAQCLYVMLGETGRKALRWVVIALLGKEAIQAFREVMFGLIRRF